MKAQGSDSLGGTMFKKGQLLCCEKREREEAKKERGNFSNGLGKKVLTGVVSIIKKTKD